MDLQSSAGSRSERTQRSSITLLRVDWSCLRMRKDGLSLSTEERRLSVGMWRRWQRAKRQQRLSRVLSLFCLDLAAPTTLKRSLDTQPSSTLWSCTIREKRPLFLPGIGTSAWKPWLYSVCSGSLWTRYGPCAKATTAKFLCHVISGIGAPATRLPLLGLVGHRGESVGFPQRWLLSLK